MKIDTFNLHRSRQKYVAKMGSRQLARRHLARRHLADTWPADTWPTLGRHLARRHLADSWPADTWPADTALRNLGRDLSPGDISPPTFRPIL